MVTGYGITHLLNVIIQALAREPKFLQSALFLSENKGLFVLDNNRNSHARPILRLIKNHAPVTSLIYQSISTYHSEKELAFVVGFPVGIRSKLNSDSFPVEAMV